MKGKVRDVGDILCPGGGERGRMSEGEPSFFWKILKSVQDGVSVFVMRTTVSNVTPS